MSKSNTTNPLKVETKNYGIAVEPEKLYPVTYTINQDQLKEYKLTYLKGKDMTENQIKTWLHFLSAIAPSKESNTDGLIGEIERCKKEAEKKKIDWPNPMQEHHIEANAMIMICDHLLKYESNTDCSQSFLACLEENYQAQIAGYYNYDKTDEERKIRNAVIEEYKDLIAIYKSKYLSANTDCSPFPLKDILRLLSKGTKMLLDKHNYDGPDYEEMEICLKGASEIINETANTDCSVEQGAFISRQNEIIGRLTTEVSFLKDSQSKRDEWLREAKQAAGYDNYTSFDVVWKDALAALKSSQLKPVDCSVEKNVNEIDGDLRMIIGHAFLGEEQNISRGAFDLVIGEIIKYFNAIKSSGIIDLIRFVKDLEYMDGSKPQSQFTPNEILSSYNQGSSQLKPVDCSVDGWMKIKVEYPDHYKVILTNERGDTYTSKSEELMDFLTIIPLPTPPNTEQL